MADLWGLEYESQYCFGRNLFDPSYTGLYIPKWGYLKTDNYYYDEEDGEFLELGSYSLQLAQEEVKEALRKRDACRLILEMDYFKDEESN